MATNNARRGRRPTATGDNRNARIEMTYVDINSLQAYEFNPRDNAKAVEAVANSIKGFGFLIPVVVDRNYVLVAGHTRIEAAKTLGLAEVPAVFAEHLSEDQIRAFRVIDNKVAEMADWDFALLSHEINALKDSGIAFSDYGWTREELSCLDNLVADDCMSTDNLVTQEDRQRLASTERRTPTTARYVLGEHSFFVSMEVYREWIDSIREEAEYDESRITAILKARLGIPDEGE